MEEPIASVIMMTYGHESFIKQAIEGVLMQEVNFPIELIIANDNSPDNTDFIVKDLLKDHSKSSLVKYIKHQENKGMMGNFIFALEQCKGKYIAICEGDDYWVNPLKLQKQVDFLDVHQDYGLVHSDVNHLFDKNGEIITDFRKRNKLEGLNGFVYEDLLKANHISTLTVLFRKSLLKYFYNINKRVINSFLMVDYVMWLEFSRHCKFKYIPESMATYRILENSASNHSSYDKRRLFLNSYYDIKLFFLKKYPSSTIFKKDIELMRLKSSILNAIYFKQYKKAFTIMLTINFKNWVYLLRKKILI